MADDGVLVTSMGFAPATDSPAKEMDSAKNFLEGLVAAGFASVRDYEEVRHIHRTSLSFCHYPSTSNVNIASTLLSII